jgi:[ribosomal protein S5]-alanine N-acetyltransferase
MGSTNEFNRFIEGERIYLREVRPADVNEEYYKWMNDSDVTKHLESRFYPNSKESLLDFVTGKLRDKNNIFLAVIIKDGERHIGNIKLGPIDWIHRLADVALLIGAKDFWGRGYGTEAIGLIVNFAFRELNLHKLTAGHYSANVGSGKAFTKNGFVVEGVRRKHRFFDGDYVDTVLLGLLNEDIKPV